MGDPLAIETTFYSFQWLMVWSDVVFRRILG